MVSPSIFVSSMPFFDCPPSLSMDIHQIVDEILWTSLQISVCCCCYCCCHRDNKGIHAEFLWYDGCANHHTGIVFDEINAIFPPANTLQIHHTILFFFFMRTNEAENQNTRFSIFISFNFRTKFLFRVVVPPPSEHQFTSYAK